MPEQFGFDQVARNRGHVDRNERSVAALAVIVQRPSHQLLAGAGLARDHHGEVGLHQARDQTIDFLHRRRTPNQRDRLEVIGLTVLRRTPLGFRQGAADDGAASDRFGLSLAVDGDIAIFGSPSAQIGANGYQGAAYVFARSADAWSLKTKLTTSDGAAFDEFGVSVALDAGTAVVGAHYADVVYSGQGAAYAFVGSGDTWSEEGKLVSDDAFFGDEFGFSVAVSGDTAAVGALFADAGGTENEGEAYIFTRGAGTWSEAAKLFPDTATMGGEFGIGVAVESDTAIVGAESAPVAGDFRGAAYVFSSASATPVPAAQVSPGALSFSLAPGTSDMQPIGIANVGDAGSTLAFSIYEAADATCGAPADAAWLDAMPIDGSVAAGASQDVQVSADASALDDGEYTAWVCVSTSDPVQAFVPVAVTLTVSGTNPDVIFEDGFDAP